MHTSVTPVVPWLAGLVLAGTALTGCGSSSTPAATASPAASPSAAAPAVPSASAAPSPVAPLAPTRAEAKAAALAINLVPGDMKDYSMQGEAGTAPENPAGTAAAACYGGVDPSHALADIASPDFGRSERMPAPPTIASQVQVLPTAELVRQDLAGVTSSKAPGCLAVLFRQSFEGADVANIKVSRVSSPAAGAGSFGYRITGDLKQAGAADSPLYLEVYGIAKGRTELTMSVQGSQIPLATAERERIVALLKTRLDQHAL